MERIKGSKDCPGCKGTNPPRPGLYCGQCGNGLSAEAANVKIMNVTLDPQGFKGAEWFAAFGAPMGEA